MGNIIWKAYHLKDIFKRNTPPSTNVPAKELEIYEEPSENLIALITRAETNNGIRGYIEREKFPTRSNVITYNDQFSFFLYHDYEFTTIKDHLSIISAYNLNFQNILSNHKFVNGFLVTILNHIFSKEIFSYTYTGADYRFDREIILLPCLEVTKNDDYIWEEDGRYYTLAVDYIEKLMNEAKELREQKTIRLYEAERAKYERERAKYEEGYKRDRDVLMWKAYKLGDIFERSTELAFKKNQKDLSLSETKNNETDIALISASRNGSGCVGYLDEKEVPLNLISVNKITFDDQWGFTYFQKERFVITGGHNAILEVKNTKLENLMLQHKSCFSFICLILNKITIKSGIFGYGYKINNKFDREIILLPCLEVTKNDDYIWEEDGRYYTLAVDYISYMYLSGRVEYNQKLIDKYEYRY